MKCSWSVEKVSLLLLAPILLATQIGAKIFYPGDNRAERNCPSGTRCVEINKCTNRDLGKVAEEPRRCGYSYNSIKRICCPEKPRSRRISPISQPPRRPEFNVVGPIPEPDVSRPIPTIQPPGPERDAPAQMPEAPILEPDEPALVSEDPIPELDTLEPVPEEPGFEPDAPAQMPEAPRLEPDVSAEVPELDVSAPEPEEPMFEYDITTSVFEKPRPEPNVPAPEPEEPIFEYDIPPSKFEEPRPEPDVSAPEPWEPTPESDVPETEEPILEPNVLSSEPEEPRPEPNVPEPEPEEARLESDIPASVFEESRPVPDVLAPVPEQSRPEPEIPAPIPEDPRLEPDVFSSEPEETTPEPDIPEPVPEEPRPVPVVPAPVVPEAPRSKIDNQKCGQLNRLQGYVIGNGFALQGAWPWLISIAIKGPYWKYYFSCTGSMITRRHAIAAARCFEKNRNPSIYAASIGHVNEIEGHQYDISRIVIHKGYHPSRFGQFYDSIAILTLKQEVSARNFHPICIPPSRYFEIPVGGVTTVAGWRSTLRGSRSYLTNHFMQQGGLRVLPNEKCIETLVRRTSVFQRKYTPGLYDNFICAGFPVGGKDICSGDSGGPMMMLFGDRWYLVGIVGNPIGIPGALPPVEYTRVSEYLDWIRSNINDSRSEPQPNTWRPRNKRQ